MWMMGIANSYTMEASFGGTRTGSKSYTHFSPQDYEQMGRVFCQTLLDFCDEDPRKVKGVPAIIPAPPPLFSLFLELEQKSNTKHILFVNLLN